MVLEKVVPYIFLSRSAALEKNLKISFFWEKFHVVPQGVTSEKSLPKNHSYFRKITSEKSLPENQTTIF